MSAMPVHSDNPTFPRHPRIGKAIASYFRGKGLCGLQNPRRYRATSRICLRFCPGQPISGQAEDPNQQTNVRFGRKAVTRVSLRSG